MTKRSKGPPAPKRGRGNPTAYHVEYCDLARRMCENGATDQEVADVLRVDRATLYRWLAEHSELRDAMRLGKEPADDRVERALYARAVGYEFDTVKIMQDKGAPVIVPYREHVPPDPTASLRWLLNRRPEAWRDRKELTGADGEPLTVKLSFVPGAGT